MTFHAKLTCDAGGCFNEKEFNSYHPSDAEIELHDVKGTGEWLFDNDGHHYCSDHAMQAAKELDLVTEKLQP